MAKMAKGSNGSVGKLAPAVLLLSVAACGVESQPAPDLCGVVSALAEGTCNQMERCVSAAYTAAYAAIVGNESVGCTHATTNEYGLGIAERWRTGIERGRIVYHPEGLEACRTAMASTSCVEAITEDHLPSACSAVFEGTRSLGQSCADSLECEAGLACTDSRCSEPEPPPRHECEDCRATATCAEFPFLSPVCAARGETAPCGGSTQCSGYRMCVGATPTEPGHCESIRSQRTQGPGEPCGGYWFDLIVGGLCRDGLFCAEASRDPTGHSIFTCEAPYDSGASCYQAYPDACPDTEYCQRAGAELMGRCTPLPGRDEPCAGNTSLDVKQCADGFLCQHEDDDDRGRCVDALEDGAECSSSRGELCASGICASRYGSTRGFCAARVCG